VLARPRREGKEPIGPEGLLVSRSDAQRYAIGARTRFADDPKGTQSEVYPTTAKGKLKKGKTRSRGIPDPERATREEKKLDLAQHHWGIVRHGKKNGSSASPITAGSRGGIWLLCASMKPIARETAEERVQYAELEFEKSGEC